MILGMKQKTYKYKLILIYMDKTRICYTKSHCPNCKQLKMMIKGKVEVEFRSCDDAEIMKEAISKGVSVLPTVFKGEESCSDFKELRNFLLEED